MLRRFHSSRVSLLLQFLIVAAVLSSMGASAGEPLININSAPPEILAEKLPGIGPAKARAIVLYREQQGAFETLDELTQVKGIGDLTLKKIRSLIHVGQPVGKTSSVNSGNTGAVPPAKSQAKIEADVVRAIRAAVNVARRQRGD